MVIRDVDDASSGLASLAPFHHATGTSAAIGVAVEYGRQTLCADTQTGNFWPVVTMSPSLILPARCSCGQCAGAPAAVPPAEFSEITTIHDVLSSYGNGSVFPEPTRNL